MVLESTTYPGTTDEDLRAVLEEGSGMKAGVDFHLAFSRNARIQRIEQSKYKVNSEGCRRIHSGLPRSGHGALWQGDREAGTSLFLSRR